MSELYQHIVTGAQDGIDLLPQTVKVIGAKGTACTGSIDESAF